MQSPGLKILFALFLLLGAAQSGKAGQHNLKAAGHDKTSPASTEEISGMYSFLREGEFVQINVEENGVSGYISRQGDLDSDRGAFLDQFFDKASVEGHDVFFNTKPLHGVTFTFKGKFERGSAKSKIQDGYYILRGTLTELITGVGAKTTSRSREVTFKLLGQPPDDESGKGKD
ncbi:MAG TPA: hypothetical protein VFP59_18550 [Candidatus Angelobacter sp.]|nr:hypothetical protein [Candidatus Angelobacter sp.]